MTNSEARKRAAEAASRTESAPSQPNSPNAGPSQSGWQIGPQVICQCGANGWHICPNAAPVDSGAIGLLNEAERADLDESLAETGCHGFIGDHPELYAAVERIVREHTDRALAEVEEDARRLHLALDDLIERLGDMDRAKGTDPTGLAHWQGYDQAARECAAELTHIVRAARQERGR